MQNFIYEILCNTKYCAIFVTYNNKVINKTMQTQILTPKITPKSNINLNSCEVVRVDRFYGWNVVDEFGNTVAHYDGNYDEYKFYEDYTQEEKQEIKELIQYEI